MQVPPTQVLPSQQSALLSQRSPAEWQQRPVMHCIPSQQSFADAHTAVASAQHAPLRHSSPRSQAVSPQQRCVAAPQRVGSGGASRSGTSSGTPRSSTKASSVDPSRSATWPPAQAERPHTIMARAA